MIQWRPRFDEERLRLGYDDDGVLQALDLITAVDGEPIAFREDLIELVGDRPPGERRLGANPADAEAVDGSLGDVDDAEDALVVEVVLGGQEQDAILGGAAVVQRGQARREVGDRHGVVVDPDAAVGGQAVVVQGRADVAVGGVDQELEALRRWTARLDPGLRAVVAEWPFVLEVEYEGVRVACMHYEPAPVPVVPEFFQPTNDWPSTTAAVEPPRKRLA